MPEYGSDCPTGKRQWATREAAEQSVRAAKHRGWRTMNSYKCPLCRCWHTGNKMRFESTHNRYRSRKNRRR